MSSIQGEPVLNLGDEGAKAFVAGAQVNRMDDPTLNPQYTQPTDFTAQYPQPLDPTEIMRLCEEITLWQFLPEKRTALNAETWREMDELAFTSGTNYLSFPDGYCPEAYAHAGHNTTIDHMNIGAKKNLSIRDIMHSTAVASLPMGAINTLVGGAAAGQGMPGGNDIGTFQREVVRGVKEKEVRLAMTLVMNGWDNLLIQGNSDDHPLEFDGFENWATHQSCTMHTNINTASGTFSATSFDRFLSESCAKPTALIGHPATIQEMLLGYFTLGFQGSQIVNHNDGGRLVPGFNFASFVNTGVGRLQVVADANFTRGTPGGSTTQFLADIWAMRMTHNGEPLVYKSTQIPLSYQDLAPGCTAVAFEIWAATALIIKNCCMQGKWTSLFTGRVVSTCTLI